MRHPERPRVLIYEPNGGSSYIYELGLGLSELVDLRIGTHARWIRDHPHAEAFSADLLKDIPPSVSRHRKLLPRIGNHWAMARFARKWKPHIIHFHYFQHAALDYPLFSYLRERHATVATVHNVAPHGESDPRSAGWDRRLFGLFDALVVHHEVLRDELAASHRIPDKRIHVIPRCLPRGGMFETESEDRETARQRLGFAEQDFVLLAFGGLRGDKRIDLLVEALALLPANVKLLIAGASRGREREVQRLIEVNGIPEKRIVRHLSFVPRNQVSRYFSASDAVAMPYESFHGQSANLFTAYVFGKPVIASDSGAMGQTVRADQSGIVLTELTAGTIAGAVERMLVPENLQRWRENVGQARDQYTPDRVAAATYSLYRDILGNPDRRGSIPA